MNKRSSKGTFTLPGRQFTSIDIFQVEMEKIFSQWWINVGRSEQIADPRSYLRLDYGQESIILTRDHSGELRAFYNFCRHRGVRLCEHDSAKTSNSIQCPYHAWTYGLDGALIGAPNMKERAGFVFDEYGLIPTAAAEWEGFLFVNFAENPQPFPKAYQPLLDKFNKWRLPELRIVRRIEYQVQANWKLIFQNYSECYHCPTLHPALNALSPYQDSSNDLDEGPFLGGPMHLAASGESMTVNGRLCAATFGDLDEAEVRSVYYYTLFPNMFLSLHPDYVLIHRLEPQAPDQTKIICEWLFAPEAIAQADFDPSGAVDFWNMTNEQDWHICELSQQGVSSRAYIPGPYADLESITAAFDRQYLKSLG